MARKLFGTDGIRGRANTYPVNPEIALKLGKAVGKHFKAIGGFGQRVVIGKDTRLSGYMLENALTSGLVSMGMDVFLVGPVPTPAVAHLTKSLACIAGFMITASHNPYTDNGIKIFNADGFKLNDAAEEEIEGYIFDGDLQPSDEDAPKLGQARRIEDARGRYIEFAKSAIRSENIRDMKIVLDCANGATYKVAPIIFTELGAEVITLNDHPNGMNINDHCG
ncbi:MAG TPA: phosphoglucosamine mutase, partial [Phycisphaerae bacterium]|nr:phosphoglucosamine mutase [Phycisphaerae bacterium]